MVTQTTMMDALRLVRLKLVTSVVHVMVGHCLGLMYLVLRSVETLWFEDHKLVMMGTTTITMDALQLAKMNPVMSVVCAMDGPYLGQMGHA